MLGAMYILWYYINAHFNGGKGRASAINIMCVLNENKKKTETKIVKISSTIDIYLNQCSIITKFHKVLLLKMSSNFIESHWRIFNKI